MLDSNFLSPTQSANYAALPIEVDDNYSHKYLKYGIYIYQFLYEFNFIYFDFFIDRVNGHLTTVMNV